MIRNTDEDWESVARSEPYWGVLSVPAFESSRLTDAARAEFFKSGEQYVSNLIAATRKHIDAGFAPKRVLDFGCGVGRLALPFAQRVEQVVGVDVAPAMLELLRQNAERMGLSNLVGAQSDDELSQVDGTFDLVNTYIVLQHIDPARGMRLVERLVSKLAIGGVGSIQLTYGKDRRFWPHEAGQARFYRREGSTIHDLAPVQDARPVGSITMYDYDLNHLFAIVGQVAGAPMLTLPTNDDGHLGLHLIFKKVR